METLIRNVLQELEKNTVLTDKEKTDILLDVLVTFLKKQIS